LSSIFLGETGDSYIASEGYDIKKHRINHRLLTNQSSIFCRHWLLKAALGVKPLIHQSKVVPLKKIVPFAFNFCCCILTNTEWNGIIKIDIWS
jgi:hypothetical protein